MSGSRIELHIEELVLHGFEHAEGDAIGEALRARLGETLAAYGLPPQLRQETTIDRIDGGSIDSLDGGMLAGAVDRGIREA